MVAVVVDGVIDVFAAEFVRNRRKEVCRSDILGLFVWLKESLSVFLMGIGLCGIGARRDECVGGMGAVDFLLMRLSVDEHLAMASMCLLGAKRDSFDENVCL